MTIEEEIFGAQVDAAVNEVLAGLDRREAETEERKRVWVEQRLQIEMVKLIERKAA